MLLVSRPLVTKGPTKYRFSLFARPLAPFFEGARLFAPIDFFRTHFSQKNNEPCAHDAHIIFPFPAIILLAVLASRFLLFAHRCSLFFLR